MCNERTYLPGSVFVTIVSSRPKIRHEITAGLHAQKIAPGKWRFRGSNFQIFFPGEKAPGPPI